MTLFNGRSNSKRRFVASRQPHWTVVPTFWLVLVSVLLSAAAITITIVLNWNQIKAWVNNP